MIDVESLLEPVSGESPCGENLEYDASFVEMERAVAGRPDQQFGSTVVEGEGPDWPTVQRTAIELFERTKDLRVAVYLTRSLLVMQGWPAFRDGLAVTRGLVERFWEPVHPQLDPDDDLDPTLRINTLAALADQDSTLNALRRTPLVRSRVLGVFGFREVELARGELAPVGEEKPPEMSAVEGAFADVEFEAIEVVATAVREALAHASGIEAAVSDKAGYGQGVQLGPLTSQLKKIDKFLGEQLAKRRPAEAAADEPGEAAAGAEAAGTGGRASARLSGEVSSREDVIRGIDKLCEYYAKYEPSSPVPLLLMRAKRLATMSFIEIMKELTPNGLDQALSVGGITDGG